MQNNTQELEEVQNNFNSICDDIVNLNNASSQPADSNQQKSDSVSSLQKYAIPIINKIKSTRPWEANSKIDKPGGISAEQLIKIIELRHKYADHVRFYELSKIVVAAFTLFWLILLCISFCLSKIK